jgi:hypothetical protein
LDQFHNAAQPEQEPEPTTKRREQRTVRDIGMPAASVGKCREKVETKEFARAIEVRFYIPEDVYILTKRI